MPLLPLLEQLAFWVRHAPVALTLGHLAVATVLESLPGRSIPPAAPDSLSLGPGAS